MTDAYVRLAVGASLMGGRLTREGMSDGSRACGGVVRAGQGPVVVVARNRHIQRFVLFKKVIGRF